MVLEKTLDQRFKSRKGIEVAYGWGKILLSGVFDDDI
jgi:hypothetical protein